MNLRTTKTYEPSLRFQKKTHILFHQKTTKKRRRKILDSFGCHRRPAPLEGRQPGPLYFRTISRRCEGSKRLRTLGVLAQEICVEITLVFYIYIPSRELRYPTGKENHVQKCLLGKGHVSLLEFFFFKGCWIPTLGLLEHKLVAHRE